MYDIETIHESKTKGWTHKIHARQYKTAPSCFMLRVDGRVFFEPFVYGNIKPSGEVTNLGRDMPLFEFVEKPGKVFEPMPERLPFKLLDDHFTFVFNRASHLELPHSPRA